MKTIDLSLFEGEPFVIKTKTKINPEGRDYIINGVDSILEIKLMQYQSDITSKASNWKNIEQQDLDRWRDLLIKIIKLDTQDINETDINKISPIHMIGILTALINHLNDKSQVIIEALSDEAKAEMKKYQDDIKKKITLNA